MTNRAVQKCVQYCDAQAAEFAAANGLTKDRAYSELLRTDPLFKVIWRGAMTINAPGE